MEADQSPLYNSPKPSLSVTEIGEYIRFESCERRLKLGLNGRALAKKLPFAERLFNTIDPVLRREGRLREDQWEDSLREANLTDLTNFDRDSGEGPPWEGKGDATPLSEFLSELGSISEGERAFGREIEVSGWIEAFHLRGQMDFVLLLWKDGSPKLRIVECKASRKDRTYHLVQVALYRLLVQKHLENRNITIDDSDLGKEDVECVVARIDESTNNSQDILELPALNLSTITADVRQLLSDSGPVAQVVDSDLEDLDYQLNQKCDGCVFDVHCFTESARNRRLELLGIDPSNVRALERSGVESLDDLAELDLDDPAVAQLRESHEFTESIEDLIQRAGVRRTTLPDGDADPDSFEVEPLENAAESQLPHHEIEGDRLVRIYLSVSYDYVEDRVGALAAHITDSRGHLHTDFTQEENGDWKPDPDIVERLDENGGGTRPVQGEEVIRPKQTSWSGNYTQDNGSERELIQSFLVEIINRIAEVAGGEEEVRLHFYVWSRSEMSQLMEACSRVGSRLLATLRQLMGSRESLEQLIFSSLKEEVDRRFALGWTGRGLSVATSLNWFGSSYHWTRRIAGNAVDLDRIAEQDIFDFKTTLGYSADWEWEGSIEEADNAHTFEIRARTFDSLSAPYWRAAWRELPDPENVNDSKVADSIERYRRIAQPGVLRGYLEARVHALRWVEERIRFKNDEITKPLMVVDELQEFTLGVEGTAQAAIDFLRLDHHVGVTDWTAQSLAPPSHRVPTGSTLPLRDVTVGGDPEELTATLALDDYPVEPRVLEGRCSFETGSFVRVSPCFDDPSRGQTVGQLLEGGVTCVIRELDWETGDITLDVIPRYRPDRYRLNSYASGAPGDVRFEDATLDDSPSDFVAGRVDRHLSGTPESPAYDWFNPEEPAIPERDQLIEDERENYRGLLNDFVFPDEGFGLTDEQIDAALDGLESRVQLILGPPGTGKTATGAVATLLRIAKSVQEGAIVLVGGHTHRSVDTFLSALNEATGEFSRIAEERDVSFPEIEIAKIHSSQDRDSSEDGITDLTARGSYQEHLRPNLDDGVVVAGGTTSSILKFTDYLDGLASFDGIPAPMLIVDEASMMVFPHFLALASRVAEDGQILLAGDHRQLTPITSHEWEEEDRPPVEAYRPFVSAYEAVRRLTDQDLSPFSVRESELRYTHRLPPSVRSLVGRLYRDLDDVELEGEPFTGGGSGLYLVVHDERSSRQNNEFEAALVEHLLQMNEENLNDNSVAIVTPHRAQRAQLKTQLHDLDDPIQVIDTVEKVQGAGVPTVIVSATVSDPSAISARADFILDLNRANVAFSRAQRRLVVIASRSLIDYVPSEMEHYESAMLWKALRELCTENVTSYEAGGYSAEVLTPGSETLQDIR